MHVCTPTVTCTVPLLGTVCYNASNIHSIENQDINAPSLEDGVDEPNWLLNTQTSRVCEEVNFDVSESEHTKERSESDTYRSEDIQGSANNLEVPKERSNSIHFNLDDQRQYFELGMIFDCVYGVREEIAKYAISRGVALKFVRSERRRIRVKCADECPFVLYVSKDGSNPRLAVKALVPKHNC